MAAPEAPKRRGVRLRRPKLDRWRRYRLILVILSLLIAAHLGTVAYTLYQRADDTGGAFRFPLPAQAAAIAELIEAAPAEQLPLILDAVNSADFRVVVASRAAVEGDEVVGASRLPSVEQIIADYAAALAPLEVTVYVAADANETLSAKASAPSVGEKAFELGYTALWSDRPLRMDIELSGDRVLRIETRGGDLAGRIFNWPLGLIAGAIGVFIALFAVRAMWREIKPLTVLAARLDRFARAVRPQPMDENGPEEIRAVIGAFNRMQGRVSELLQARSVMLGALGHDLRTYLTRLRLRADLVEDAAQQAKMVGDLDAMESVIAASTALARLEGGPVEAQETALAPIFTRLAEAHPRLEITPAALGSDAVVWGDRDAIQLALDNMVNNAFRYGRTSADQQAEVEVDLVVEDDPLGRSDPRAVIMVRDRGPGVAAGAQEKLFKAFMRGDAARNLNAPGSGLGLAIVEAVARAHRGAASLRNRGGGGLEARLVLPVAF